MAKLSIAAGSTGISASLFIQSATATDGAGMTGLVGTSAGLTFYYYRPNEHTTAVPVTLATSSLTAAWTSALFVEVNSTAMPGFYRFDIPNAVIGTGDRSVAAMFKGVTGMAPLPLEIELTAWNNQDGVRGGLTSLSTAVPGALNGMFIAGTNNVTNVNFLGTHTGNLTGSVGHVLGTATVALWGGTHTGAVIPVVQTASGVVGAVGSVTGSVGSVAGTSTMILAAGTHAGVVIPIVQTASQVAGNVAGSVATVTGAVGAVTTAVWIASGTHTGAIIPTVNTIASNVAGNVTGSVAHVLGTATVVLNAGTHTDAVIPVVQTASSVVGAVGSVTATVVLSTGTHTGAIIPTVNSIASNVAGSVAHVLSTATVILNSGTHAGAIIPVVDTISSGVNVIQVGSDTNIGTKLKRLVQGNVTATVGNGSSTTSVVTSTMDPAAAVTDQFKGRILTFDEDTTTANLRGQSTSISASTSGGVLTVVALTDAPVNGDTFTIS